MMRPFASIRKRKRSSPSAEDSETVASNKIHQTVPLRPTQILPAMDIGLQILASMDPREARRIHRSLKNKG